MAASMRGAARSPVPVQPCHEAEVGLGARIVAGLVVQEGVRVDGGRAAERVRIGELEVDLTAGRLEADALARAADVSGEVAGDRHVEGPLGTRHPEGLAEHKADVVSMFRG